MLIALSGTPGVGKTAVSELLKEKGYTIIDCNQLALDNKLDTGYDDKRESKIIDTEKLDEFIIQHFKSGDFIIEGHLTHVLSVDLAIILRCDPLVLKQRLNLRNWQNAKIRENVEAEILDVIKVEAYETLDKVFELDTTIKTPNEVADEVVDIINGYYKEPNINWLEKYEYLLFE